MPPAPKLLADSRALGSGTAEEDVATPPEVGTAVVDAVLPGTLIRIINGFEAGLARAEEIVAGGGLRVVATGEAIIVWSLEVVPLLTPTPVPLTRLFWTGAAVIVALDGTVV